MGHILKVGMFGVFIWDPNQNKTKRINLRAIKYNDTNNT